MSEPGNANPSQNPADTGTLGGVLRWAFKKLMQSTDGMLPATVIAVDAMRQYATVQPQIQVLATDNSLTPRAQIAKVPIFALGAGGFVLSFPVKVDDSGWIVASDRDISLYLQTNKSTGPNTNRLHSFEDGLFFTDAARQFVLADDDAANAVWQALDGSVKIAIGPASIKLLHPALVDVEAPQMNMSGNVTVEGNLSAGNGATGSFTTVTGQVVTVQNGIVVGLP